MIDNIKKLLNSNNPEDQELGIQLSEDLSIEEQKQLLDSLIEDNPNSLNDKEIKFLKQWIDSPKGDDDLSPFQNYLTTKQFNSWISRKI